MVISFEDCQADRLPALRVFFARMYGPDYVLRVNERQFSWQYGDTPVSDANGYHMRLGLVDGEIKGCLGYVPLEISVAGRVVHGAWLANWMVDPGQRQYGLGLLVMRRLMSEFDITLTVGTNQAAHGLLTRLGWTDFGLLPRYVCVLDSHAAGALTENGTLDWPDEVQSARAHAQTPTGDAGFGLTTRLVDRFEGDATQLWDRAWGESGAGTRRSAEFLNWRYAGHPVLHYRLLEARRDSRLCGLAVYRVEDVRDVPVKVGRIVELVAEETAQDCLLDELRNDARSQGVAALDFFCSSRRFAGTMARHGFLPGENEVASQIPILFQPINRRRSGIPFLAYLRNFPDEDGNRDWYVTKGDGDQDRPN
jgi:hypothetical protein